LEQYLKEGRKHHELQLILEIKIQPNEMMEKAAVDETVRLVKKLKMEKQINYISFSKFICDQLRAAFPYAEVAMLSDKYDPTATKEACLSGVDYNYKVFKKNPKWIKQCREKGLNINVWTVDKPEMIQSFIDKDVDFITTNNPVVAQELINKKYAK
jgi:Glycerophosphoryl diester phosphodiesterase